MKRNMKIWFEEALAADRKKPIPILSFPIASKMGMTVAELLSSSEVQARGMKKLADSVDSWIALSFMDLSVEAEAFGAQVKCVGNEVPTIIGQLLSSHEEVDALSVPQVGAARTAIYVEGIRQTMPLITDRPVLAGCIGPFSLTGRLMDITDIFIKCKKDPELVHKVLDKATQFIIEYAKAYKAAGANGICMAEPLAGILSPKLIQQFSSDYVKKVIDAVQDDEFAVVYHNCGNSVMHLLDSILTCGANAYHFGNAVDMETVLGKVPADIIVMGNIDPASQFCMGTPESIRQETLDKLKACGSHKNFIISSGCDIPPHSPWENIEAFFAAVEEFYDN
ncbi:methyltransferase [Aminipila butyrica]|uniref:Methyltransferase n=1 Tax=Aminipila butyrica TaxID=433296 RepID=A0A858BYG6_9FIRM|nr:uroporphyrinogen decarboxylase family protein [Aminipila butyrica]QIB70175.1 methyltransferase [Aminipila butyrica]